MPIFAAKGPHVPDALVQALEDDRVIVFCGAGISVGAGLPTYNGLVQHCYDTLGITAPTQKDEWKWPDRLLGALEDSCTPMAVRRVVAERLSQDPTTLELHHAILRLARLNRAKGTRLVTTNFDTFFERAQTMRAGSDHYSAPALPIPRNDRIASWKSVVYLHGRIGDVGDPNDHLVLTSADFGRAYLTEAWAARFVARLFADFTVLFVGYSLNDPVLRYMTDAFAAEASATRVRSERGPAYIFIGFTGSKPPDPDPWKKRQLEPIFYHQGYKHLRLKQCLMGWASAREDFLSNTSEIVRRFAPNLPQALNPSDTENLMWALFGRGDDGHGARAFAQLSDPPPIEWLFEIERRENDAENTWRRRTEEAQRSGSEPPQRPIAHIRRLVPATTAADSEALTAQAAALLPWLAKHLHRQELVDWMVERLEAGRRPHFLLRDQIRRTLRDAELPRGLLLFWRIIAAEGEWARDLSQDFASLVFQRELGRHPDSAWARQEFLSMLRPYVHFSKSMARHFREGAGGDDMPAAVSLASFADADVYLAAHRNMRQIVAAIDRIEDPEAFLSGLWFDLTRLLLQVLDLFAAVERADIDIDPSAFDRPSIRPHDQNRDFREWTLLFDLLWRAWREIDEMDADRSREIVRLWRGFPYLAFRRLVMAAMTASNHFTDEERLEALFNGA